MPLTIYMPKLSPTMESGTIVKWHKKEGDQVDAGDLLFEVATDKATIEYNAIDSGFIGKILVQENSEAEVNQPVAILKESQNESLEGFDAKSVSPQKAEESLQDSSSEKKEEPKSEAVQQEFKEIKTANFTPPPLVPAEKKQTSSDGTKRIIASPLAKKLASDQNLDLSSLSGTGPGGRIMSKDLVNAKVKGSTNTKALPDIEPGSYTEETLSPMRKVISQRLQESKSSIPHFYVQQTVNVENLVSFRDQLKALDQVVSFNDCIVKASAMALKKHPIVNSGFNSKNNTIIHYQTVDVAVAVSISGGLITPIVRFTDYKNIFDISHEIRELAKRAKANKLEPHEYQGGSFTVSNLGMFGTTQFQAIINPPQAAILAVGGILDVPVVKNGIVVPGKVLNLTLSVDHRVVDGVEAAEFMKTLQQIIENPVSLLI